jgi:hypothetical protein
MNLNPSQLSDAELRTRLKDAFAVVSSESAKSRNALWPALKLSIDHMFEDINLADNDQQAQAIATTGLHQALDLLTSQAAKTSDRAIEESLKNARETQWELKHRGLSPTP